MDPVFKSLSEASSYPLAPGATAKPLFGERGMLNLVELAPDAEVATHSHPHEQIGLILRGSMEMTIGGERRTCGPMDGFVAPGGVEHSGRAGAEGATVVDVFVPVRDDYRERAATA